MQKRQNDSIQCRFCLSEKACSLNPLISPCDCKGSIEFVHLRCLNIWRNKNIERNYSNCSLCYSGYRIPTEYTIEHIPKMNIWFVVVDHPILVNLTCHYAWIIYAGVIMNQKKFDMMSSYSNFQLCYHLYYGISMAMNFAVIKRDRYFAAWKQEYRRLFFPFYGILVLMASSSTDSLLWFIPSIFVTMFWNIHIHILEQMNTEDLQQGSEGE